MGAAACLISVSGWGVGRRMSVDENWYAEVAISEGGMQEYCKTVA
jgi:hypothetical protein